MRFYYVKLDRYIKRAIRKGECSLEEVKRIRNNLEETIKINNKRFGKILIVIFVIMVVLGILSLFQGTPIILFLEMIPMYFVIFAICWFACVGNLKFEYNLAVRKGYPEYKKELFL